MNRRIHPPGSYGLLTAAGMSRLFPHKWPKLFLAGAAIASLATSASPSAAYTDVLTSRYDDERTGANLHETFLAPETVNVTDFGKLFAYELGDGTNPVGHVYAQPLYVSHLGIPGKGLVNAVFVATTNNLVSAFDADGPKTGSDGVLWKRSLGTPPSINDVWKNCSLESPCLPTPFNNIEGNVGVMSTPVIDRSRGIIFLVARVLQAGGIIYQLHALDLRTGDNRAGSPIDIHANASGIEFQAEIQNQRTGLALANGQIIIAWGGHADYLKYHGWVMSYRYDENGFTQTGVFVTTPDGDTSFTCAVGPFPYAANNCAHGGIWMAGRAPAIDRDGQVLVMVGNGKNDMSRTNTRNFGNSLVKLDPVSLTVTDFFTPENHLLINAADLDLGGSGPMIIPDSDLVVGGGKQGLMHVWRLDNLGKFLPGDPFVVQKFPAGIVKRHADIGGNDLPGGVGVTISDHSGHIMGGPVYWSRPSSAGRMFNWSENAQLRAYEVDTTAPQPVSLPALYEGPDIQEGHPGGILTLSVNGSDLASGIIWASTYDASNTFIVGAGVTGALNQVRPGTLRAYSAENLTSLWTSDENAARDSLGTFAKFTPPTVANGRVYMATFSNQLVVYGSLNHIYPRPAASIIGPVLELLLDED